MLSWKGGQNTSVVCSIAHQISMTTLSTDCHRWSVMSCLMNSQLLLKQRKPFCMCHRADSVWFRCNTCGDKAGGQSMAGKLTELFHCMWWKMAIPQEFKDASIIHLYKRKEMLKFVTTTGASPHCRLLGRYWQTSY